MTHSIKVPSGVSEIFRIVSIIAACLVVVRHCHPTYVKGHLGSTEEMILDVVMLKATSWAVPYFFFTSGFFFAAGSYASGSINFLSFLKVKFKSLVLPYLIWSVILTTAAIPRLVLKNNILGEPWFSHTIFDCNGGLEFIDYMFGIARIAPLHGGALWYVRALIIIFLCAPVIKACLSRSIVWVLLLVAGYMLVVGGEVSILGFFVETRLPAYFLIGVVFYAYFNKRLGQVRLTPRLINVFWGLVGLSFFAYCIHTVFTTWLLSICKPIFLKHGVSLFLAVVISAISLALSFWVGLKVRDKAPRLFYLLNGGR